MCAQCLLLTSKACLYTKCRAYTLFAPSEVHFVLSNSLQFTSAHVRTLPCTAAAAVGLQMGLPLLMVIRVDGQIKRVVQFLDLISMRFYYLHEGIKVDSPFQFIFKSISMENLVVLEQARKFSLKPNYKQVNGKSKSGRFRV